jgi:hypothetical protein
LDIVSSFVVALIEQMLNPYLAANVQAGSGAPPIDSSAVADSTTVAAAN